jgi:hypothetical protein
MSQPKSVLLLLTVDDGVLLVNAPDKPPKIVRTLDELFAFIARDDVKASKAVPSLNVGDFFSGLGRIIAGSDDKPEGA